jgi:pre-mRNA-processing factor 19
VDGVAILYSLEQKQILHTLKSGEGNITAALFWEQKPVLAMSTGAIKIFENGDVMGEMLVHAGAATDISLHPSGDILASVGEDKSIVFYDLTTMKKATRIFTQSGSCLPLHPIIGFY